MCYSTFIIECNIYIFVVVYDCCVHAVANEQHNLQLWSFHVKHNYIQLKQQPTYLY